MNTFPFFESVRAVEEALRTTTDARGCLRKIRPYLEDPDVRRWFFDFLSDPTWIEPLANEGYFSSPPAAEQIEDNRRIFQMWPASQFLARSARGASGLVATVFSKVSTDNPNVLGDMLDAAMTMPDREAAAVVEKLASVLDKGAELYHGDYHALIEVAVRLAANRETCATSFFLCRSYLFPKKKKPESTSQRRETHGFLEAMTNLIPLMVPIRPEDTIGMLCQEVATAVRAKGEPAIGDPMFDYSEHWRPAIEEHEQNNTYDLAGALVTPLRNATELAVAENHLKLERVLKVVRSFEYMIFLRLAVHLINVFAEANEELAHETMLDKKLFDDYRFKHEYAMLVGKRFPLLGLAGQQTIYSWIKAGPDMSGFDDVIRSDAGRKPTAQDHEARKRYWQYERLWWIREHLDGRWRKMFDEMYAAFGQPELADLNVSITTTVRGPEGPMSLCDLIELPFSDALDKVCSWRPTKGGSVFMPVAGLARTFEEFVKQDAVSASASAELMKGKPSIFVYPFLSAMQEAVSQGKDIQWTPVLGLCQWVLERPRDEDTVPYETDEHDRVERTWKWSRDAIARFVSTCFTKDVSFEHRERLWDILLPLTHDPDEKRVWGQECPDIRVRDFLEQSINNPRAYALHVVFEYANWVAKHLQEVTKKGRKVVPGGFKVMKEVRKALVDGLKSGEHDSFAVRAAYGRHLGLIYWIDKAWLASRVDQLLNPLRSATEPITDCGWAVWNAFLVRIEPHIVYFNLLEKQFKYAADQYRTIKVEEKTPYEVMTRFGEHLMILYGRGQLGLDDHGSMLRGFLTDTSQVIRSHAIAFVGRSLSADDAQDKETLPKLPKEVIDRFVQLWDWYWPEVGSRDKDPSRDMFGYWYTCGCFDRRWAIERLAEYVERAPLPEPHYRIPKRLAEDAELNPATALSIIEKVIEADSEGWRTHGWQKEITQILSVAMKTDDKDTRTRATTLINRLGRKGKVWFSLGELLRPT